jgi:hypothetical protein
VELKRLEWEQSVANTFAVGQEILPEPVSEPSNLTPTPPTPRAHNYVLGTAENANSVATLFGVSLDAIRAANPGVDVRKLRSGDTIRVPYASPPR